jgi:hypothetical protein
LGYHSSLYYHCIQQIAAAQLVFYQANRQAALQLIDRRLHSD